VSILGSRGEQCKCDVTIRSLIKPATNDERIERFPKFTRISILYGFVELVQITKTDIRAIYDALNLIKNKLWRCTRIFNTGLLSLLPFVTGSGIVYAHTRNRDF
jgi:hypothetical protein